MSLELYKEPPALRKQCRGTPLATYDSKHQVTTASKTVGNTTQTASYTYDNYGNITGVTLSAGGSLKVTSSAVYSDYGNYLTESINELGKTTTYNYDSVTKLLKYIQNANNVHTAYTYDNRDRTTKVYLDADKDGIADTAEAQVAYLYANNRLSGIDTATTDYTLTYDAFGNVLTIKAGNYTLATYDYASNNGKLLKLTYGNGDYEQYVYDSLERLVEVKLNGATEYIVKYDNNGRLYSLTENGATHIYEYDSLDRLVRAWQEDTNGNYIVAVENSYDDLGRAKGSTYVVGDRELSYEITYKANSNLVDYVLMPVAGLQSSISYTYDEFERITRKQNSFSNSLNFYEQYEYYSYTDENEVEHTTSLVSTVTFGGNTTNASSVVYSYTYDNLGNITQIRKNGTLVESYEYDSLGQLTRENNVTANYSIFYSYDQSGNLLKSEGFNYSSAPTWHMTALFGTGAVVNYTYGNSTWGDLLTNYNGTAITYDAIGNPTKWRNAVSLYWDGRELNSIYPSTRSSLSFDYNSDGIRTAKTYSNGTTGVNYTHNYVLDGTKIIQETVSGDHNYVLYYLYDTSGEVQGFIYNNSYYYFQKNLQGDVVRILNSSGTVVTEYTYDAWGLLLSTSGSMASTVGKYNPFRYRSYYYDTETGFYYLQSRYYDPTVGRFLNADGIVGANGGIEGYNMFAYCNNSPIIHADYTGYDAVVLTCDGISGHMGIMVQDEDGVWWHFYWGASDGGSSSYSVSSLWGCEVTTWCKEYVGVVSLDSINASEQYDDEYSRMLYLYGDFSSCINEMQNPSGEYNLFNNNCAQKSLRILASADTIYQDALELAADKWRPSRAHDILKENMPNQPPIPLLQNVKNPVKRRILRRIHFEIERLLCK